METEIRKSGKGHEVYVNGELIFWIKCSYKCAEKELKLYLSKQ